MDRRAEKATHEGQANPKPNPISVSVAVYCIFISIFICICKICLLCAAEAFKCKRFRQAAKWALKLELSRLLFAHRCRRRRQCNLIMLYGQAKKLLDHALRACLHIPRVVKPYLASVYSRPFRLLLPFMRRLLNFFTVPIYEFIFFHSATLPFGLLFLCVCVCVCVYARSVGFLF